MELLGRLGPFLAGALVAYLLLPTDPVVYSEVVVPAARIVEREAPARPPTVIERFRFVHVEPRQVARAPLGAKLEVATFCAPTVARATGDTASPAPPRTILLRSGTHSPGWWFQRDELLLTGPRSDGELTAWDFEVRPGFDFRTHGDSVLVRHPRGALVRELIELGIPLGLGFLAGKAF